MLTSDEWIAKCVADIEYVAPEWRAFRIRQWRLYAGLDFVKFDKAMAEALGADKR